MAAESVSVNFSPSGKSIKNTLNINQSSLGLLALLVINDYEATGCNSLRSLISKQIETSHVHPIPSFPLQSCRCTHKFILVIPALWQKCFGCLMGQTVRHLFMHP